MVRVPHSSLVPVRSKKYPDQEADWAAFVLNVSTIVSVSSSNACLTLWTPSAQWRVEFLCRTRLLVSRCSSDGAK